MQKEITVNPTSGEVTSEKLIIDINKKKTVTYNSNEWFATNQKGVRELTKSNIAKSLYTTKGMVFHYLTSILEYGNFAPFNASYIAQELGVSRQAIYKAKKELLEDGLIKEAIDTASGVKGVVMTNIIVQKGNENSDIAVINNKKTAKSEVSNG